MIFTQYLISPAKLNLFLDVNGKCTNGYHAMSTYFKLLPQIADRIKLTWSIDKTAEPNCLAEQAVNRFLDHLNIVGLENICSKEDNLIYRALKQLFHDVYITSRFTMQTIQQLYATQLTCYVQKEIPAQGGLGGGSSNAAIVMHAVAKHFFPDITLTELLIIARKVGADCAIFVLGNSALAYRFGDHFYTPHHEEFYQALEHLYGVVTRLEEQLLQFNIEPSKPQTILNLYHQGKLPQAYLNFSSFLNLLLDLAQRVLQTSEVNPNVIPSSSLDAVRLSQFIVQKYKLWLNGYYLIVTSDFRTSTAQAFTELTPSPPVTNALNEPYLFKQLFNDSLIDLFKQENGKVINTFAPNFFVKEKVLSELKEAFLGNLYLSGTGATCFTYLPPNHELLQWHVDAFTAFVEKQPTAVANHVTMRLLNIENSSIQQYSSEL